MARITLIKIAEARRIGANGIDYSPRLGAVCPWCGNKTKIVRTMPWEDSTRIRYHLCQTTGCAMAKMGDTIKSIEIDPVNEKKEEAVCRMK